MCCCQTCPESRWDIFRLSWSERETLVSRAPHRAVSSKHTNPISHATERQDKRWNITATFYPTSESTIVLPSMAIEENFMAKSLRNAHHDSCTHRFLVDTHPVPPCFSRYGSPRTAANLSLPYVCAKLFSQVPIHPSSRTVARFALRSYCYAARKKGNRIRNANEHINECVKDREQWNRKSFNFLVTATIKCHTVETIASFVSRVTSHNFVVEQT